MLSYTQVTSEEAPALEVNEKEFLPADPKSAEEADETESW